MQEEPSYSLIHFTLKNALLLQICAAVSPLLLLCLIAWPELNILKIIAGIMMGAGAAFCMRLFIQLVNVIAETLLPR
jgi:hypothetical protein